MYTYLSRSFAAVILLGVLSRLNAVPLTANFDSLSSSASVTSPYSEGGIQFTSPSSFGVATGHFGSVLFGGGGYSYVGNALHVHNNGWVGISVPGSLMTDVSFLYGFDWNFYTIENGLMDTTFEWQTLLGGVLTGTGSITYDREHRTHGNINMSVNNGGAGFDQLLIRSTAVEYQGIYTGGTGPGGWWYERGAVIGWGDQNHIAFDNVSVQVAVADAGPGIVVAALTAAGMIFVARRRRKKLDRSDR